MEHDKKISDGTLPVYSELSPESLTERFNLYEDHRLIESHEPRLRDALLRCGLWHALVGRSGVWSAQTIRNSAKKCKTQAIFAAKHPDIYRAALARDMIAELFPKKERRTRRLWTPEAISEVATRCKTRTEFHEKYPGAYRAARERGLLPRVCRHMPDTRKGYANHLTDDSIRERAKRYRSALLFFRGDRAAYNQAVRRRLYRDIVEENGWSTDG